MVFFASDAQLLTSNSISDTISAELQLELTTCETKIRQSSRLGIYEFGYNATIIGNPKGNPSNPLNVTSIQSDFYGLLTSAGYLVGIQLGTGYWQISWALAGPETLVSVYSFRTTVEPGAIHTATETALIGYFVSLTPVSHAVASTNGFIDEIGFGGVSSTYYEYTVVVDQEYNSTDYAASAKTAMINAGLGYNAGNCNVYKLV